MNSLYTQESSQEVPLKSLLETYEVPITVEQALSNPETR
jgi:hypothetical protein